MMNESVFQSMDEEFNQNIAELDCLSTDSCLQDIDKAIFKFTSCLQICMEKLQRKEGDFDNTKATHTLNHISEMMRKAWQINVHGRQLGRSLCDALRTCSGLDMLLDHCGEGEDELLFASAKVLEMCLTSENSCHVVENGIEKAVTLACFCTKNASSVEHTRSGTHILEQLFKHSEGACSDLIRLGGLSAVLLEVRKSDVVTLRHCARALANCALFLDAANEKTIMEMKVPLWLFPLAFHNDDIVTYYSCLAIAVLLTNIEVLYVFRSGTLELIDPFITSHEPSEFAESTLIYGDGENKEWLRRLLHVLCSSCPEACNIAMYHFCLEAGIKKLNGNMEVFKEIGAIESLYTLASGSNETSTKLAIQTLKLLKEELDDSQLVER